MQLAFSRKSLLVTKTYQIIQGITKASWLLRGIHILAGAYWNSLDLKWHPPDLLLRQHRVKAGNQNPGRLDLYLLRRILCFQTFVALVVYLSCERIKISTPGIFQQINLKTISQAVIWALSIYPLRRIKPHHSQQCKLHRTWFG